MKKNLFRKVGVLAIAILTMTFSCTRENDGVIPDVKNEVTSTGSSNFARTGDLTKEDLINRLSTDENFIALGNEVTTFFDDMPQKENFRNNYDESQFVNGGAPYFLNLTGYTNEEVTYSLGNIQNLSLNLTNEYPQLEFDGKNQAFIEEVFAGAIAIIETDLANRNIAGCRACVKKWKPRMIAATIFGAVAGGILGGGTTYGVWAGTVIGFARLDGDYKIV